MELSINLLRSGLYSLYLNINQDYHKLRNDFENEEWESHSDRANTSGLAGDPYNERSGLMSPKSELLKSLLEYMGSDFIKSKIINHIYDQQGDYISKLWDGWNRDQMYKNTFWGCIYNRDLPGFNIPIHLDTRLQVLTFMIYFSENDDPDQSTYYYTDKNKSNPLRANCKIGNGILHINDHDSWHEGYNKTDKTRYTMIGGLLINVAR